MTQPLDRRAAEIVAAKHAVFFDLDDTLVHYGPGISDVWPRVFAMTGSPVVDPARLREAYDAVFKPIWRVPERQRQERTDMRRVWRHVIGEACAALNVAVTPESVAAMAEAFAEKLVATVVPFTGVVETLAALKRAGKTLVLVSNGDARIQRAKLAHTGLAPFFDALCLEGEMGAGKPDAVVFQNALRAAGCAAGEAVMVGDNFEFDVAAAVANGISGVWVARGGWVPPESAPHKPHATVHSVSELV